MKYCPLHTHSRFSHDGDGYADAQCRVLQRYNQTHLARTDHGTMKGCHDLEEGCLANGIVPIFGCEFYTQVCYTPGYAKDGIERNHVSAWCMNQVGYCNMLRALYRAETTQKYGNFPTLSHADLEEFNEGWIVATGCISSYFAKRILDGEDAEALRYLKWMRELYKDRLYVEVQPFGTGDQKYVNCVSLDYAHELSLPVIMTADSHYNTVEDYGLFSFGYQLRKDGADMRDTYVDRYLHSAQSMALAWEAMHGTDGTAYIEETQQLADRCDVHIKQPLQLPYVTPNVTEQLRAQFDVGLKEKLAAKDALTPSGDIPPKYKQRLKHELDTFERLGFTGYISIVTDMWEDMAAEGVQARPRGSACGALSAYIGFGSYIDPLVWGTVFARFCSEEGHIPDVDMDIPPSKREKVLRDFQEKYPGRVAEIGAYGCFKNDSLAKALGTYFGLTSIEVETLKGGRSYFDAEDEDDLSAERMMTLPVLRELDAIYPGLLRAYEHYHGSYYYTSKHACGVVIAPGLIQEYVPLFYQKSKGKLLTAYDKVGVEWAGLPKFDLLSVGALDTMDTAFRLSGLVYDEHWLMQPEGYDEIQAHGSTGLFQIGRRHAAEIVRQIRVKNLHELSIASSVNRPAPIKEGSLEAYLTGVGVKDVLRPFTKMSNGALIYQESVMMLCNWIGMSPTQVNNVLKMLKRYEREEGNGALHAAFVAGCEKRSITTDVAEELWQHIRRYLFCMAHSYEYAAYTVIQAVLRHRNRAAWQLALLMHEDDQKKRGIYEADTVKQGVLVLPAHVNGPASYDFYDDGGKPKIQRGLASVFDVGPVAAKAIVEERERNGPYTDFDNFYTRVHSSKVNEQRIRALRAEHALIFDEDELLRCRVQEVQRLREMCSVE